MKGNISMKQHINTLKDLIDHLLVTVDTLGGLKTSIIYTLRFRI